MPSTSPPRPPHQRPHQRTRQWPSDAPRPLRGRSHPGRPEVADRAAVVLLVAVVLGAGAVVAGATALDAWSQARSPEVPGARVDDVVLALAATAAALLAAWWSLATAMAGGAALLGTGRRAGRRLARAATRVSPTLLRVGVAAVLGAGLSAPVAASAAGPAERVTVAAGPVAAGPVAAGPVAAGPVAAGPVAAGPAGTQAVDVAAPTDAPPAPDVAWKPEPPVRKQPPGDVRAGALLAPAPTREPAADEDAAVVVVHRGDTLWDIAARHLPVNADDAEVAGAWPAWYAANRATIGADPDVLLPGQRLSVPSGAQR